MKTIALYFLITLSSLLLINCVGDKKKSSYQSIVPAPSADAIAPYAKTSQGTFYWYGGDLQLGHIIGQPLRVRDGVTFWEVTGSKKADTMSYGPYQTDLPLGRYAATFLIQADSTPRTEKIFSLDVYDAASERILSKRDIYAGDIESSPKFGAYGVYQLEFTSQTSMKLEYRIQYNCCSRVVHALTNISPVSTMENAKHRGGSNFFWHTAVGCPPKEQSNFWDNGILRSYHETGKRRMIQAALKDMFSSGQRRLRVGLYHSRGEGGGTSLDSTGGNIKPLYQTNLTQFLGDIKSAGFEEIIFGFFPMGNNNPQEHFQDDDYFQENWNVIFNTRKILVKSGLKYYIDLANEGTPWDNPSMLEYAKRLWTYYTYAFGKEDTVGFSIIPIEPVFNNIQKVYNGNYPNVFDLHPYGDVGTDASEIYKKVLAQYEYSFNKMNSLGLTQDWIIGETFYDGPGVSLALKDAVAKTGKRPLFVVQWPLTSGKCKHVDVSVPKQFNYFIQSGF